LIDILSPLIASLATSRVGLEVAYGRTNRIAFLWLSGMATACGVESDRAKADKVSGPCHFEIFERIAGFHRSTWNSMVISSRVMAPTIQTAKPLPALTAHMETSYMFFRMPLGLP
jgi:hypothetical protein